MKATIIGNIEKILYYNYINHQTSFQIKIYDGLDDYENQVIRAVGIFPFPREGLLVSLDGDIKLTSIGLVFEFDNIEIIEKDMSAVVKSILLMAPGLGKKTVKTILDNIDPKELYNNPAKVIDIPGVGEKKQNIVIRFMNAARRIEELTHIIGDALSFGDLKRLADIGAKSLNYSPYLVVDFFPKVKLERIDWHLQKQGKFDPYDARRIEAYAHQMYLQMIERTRSYVVPSKTLVSKVSKRLGIQPYITKDIIKVSNKFYKEELTDMLMLDSVYVMESDIINKLQRIINTDKMVHIVSNAKLNRMIEEYELDIPYELTDEQRRAIHTAVNHKITLITGGPGTGKTTVIKAIAEIFKKLDKSISLLTPTGKSAARISEVTGYPAHTIHHAIAWDGYQSHRPIEADVVIVDEASMITMDILWHLLSKIPASARLILVGDPDQLPPVGIGQPFTDMINSKIFPIARLKLQHRFSAGATIAEFADAINNKKELKPLFGDIVKLLIYPQLSEGLLQLYVKLIEGLQKNYQDIRQHLVLARALDKIAILTPLRQSRFELSSEWLNSRIHKALFGDSAEYQPGEKLIVMENNYDYNVFNGETYYIAQNDDENNEIVLFDSNTLYKESPKIIRIPKYDIGLFEYGYATTVHKSQGSEYDYVIIPLSAAHYRYWNKRMLYTAATRAKKKLVFVAPDYKTAFKVLYGAVKNDYQNPNTRFTRKLKSSIRR